MDCTLQHYSKDAVPYQCVSSLSKNGSIGYVMKYVNEAADDGAVFTTSAEGKEIKADRKQFTTIIDGKEVKDALSPVIGYTATICME